MRAALKHWLADWIPPRLRRVLRSISPNGAVSYSGSFASWADARQHSDGYDVAAIVERVKQAQLKVVRGEAAYERDSVLFEKIGVLDRTQAAIYAITHGIAPTAVQSSRS